MNTDLTFAVEVQKPDGLTAYADFSPRRKKMADGKLHNLIVFVSRKEPLQPSRAASVLKRVRAMGLVANIVPIS